METVVVASDLGDSAAAGRELGEQIAASPLDGADAVILFASPKYEHVALLEALQQKCSPAVIVGSSSAGEFTQDRRSEGMACAMAIRAPEMRFAAGSGQGLGEDAADVARQIVSGFGGRSDSAYRHRAALVLTDALAGHADRLVEELTLATSGQYQFFGGGAGDNAQFQRTVVFAGTKAFTNGAVALEILSEKPLGIGASHGWQPASDGLRVTETDGMRVISLNGLPAIEAFQEHAARTGQALDLQAPIPFFLHNIMGIDVASGHQLRVPLAVGDDGSVLCAAEVPTGSIVFIMRSSAQSAADAAARATEAALQALGTSRPKAAIMFDCVATRLRLGDEFDVELMAVRKKLSGISLAGCNTHGQIVRAEGQFEGFHNCTAVVCVLPE